MAPHQTFCVVRAADPSDCKADLIVTAGLSEKRLQGASRHVVVAVCYSSKCSRDGASVILLPFNDQLSIIVLPGMEILPVEAQVGKEYATENARPDKQILETAQPLSKTPEFAVMF